jgi:hypothetical protein
MSICIATMGMFHCQSGNNGGGGEDTVTVISGGGGGGIEYIERKKPIVMVTKVKYKKKKKQNINIDIIRKLSKGEIENEYTNR